jgi:hypothetical protein
MKMLIVIMICWVLMVWNPATTGSVYGNTNKELVKHRRFLLQRVECKTALAASHNVLEASSYKHMTLRLDLGQEGAGGGRRGQRSSYELRERLAMHFEGEGYAVSDFPIYKSLD